MKYNVKHSSLSESLSARRKFREIEKIVSAYEAQGLPVRIALSKSPQEGEAEAFFRLLEWAKTRKNSEVVWESNPRDARQAYVVKPRADAVHRGAEQVQSLLAAVGRGY